jgi:hypothetical protein
MRYSFGRRVRTATCVAMLSATGLSSGMAAGAEHPPAKPAAKPAPQPAGPKQIGAAKRWTAFEVKDAGGLVCYLVADPSATDQTKLKRGRPHLLVTHRTADQAANVVSIEAGYEYAPKAEVSLTIDKQNWTFFTDKETAWARDADTDRAIVAAMAKGRQLIVKGKSLRGVATTDTYALEGFSEALALIDKACKVKR